ncbi:glutamate methylesterase [Colwellia sp. MT41]|uniref:protein-glutamate methylesterase n=1 Tax=Colwellia marinimaniae TaxID=1513592 RepID=A0ABQ0MW35_9GAMM|nr:MULTISPECIES: chemotaxis protein CheB [Colwellia]ALO33738.1 glutamate methylesterase [Colwellia sp. MT41]GAW95831.1 chemotaxis protein CheB [Colwellia marinimaniae]
MAANNNALYQALVIGVSAGGLNALHKILPKLPINFPLAIIVLQHRGEIVFEGASHNDFLISYFNNDCAMPVKEAMLGAKIKPGNIYIAPAKYHLLIEKSKIFALSLEPPVNFALPSIDVLFDSASACYKNQLIGLILTGASSDGSIGLKNISDRAGLTLVQAPRTAEVDFMPKAAIYLHTVDHILPLNDIAPFLCHLMQGDKG